MSEEQQPQYPTVDPLPSGAPQAFGIRAADPRELRRGRVLRASGTLIVILGLATMVLPTRFVVEAPGPTFNTIGEVNGTKLITIPDEKTYPTAGALDMTTVFVQGGGQKRLPFLNVMEGWISPHQDVLPEEMVIPRGVTSEQNSEQNTVAMDDSQQLSTAAALTELDIPFRQSLTVAGFATEQNSKDMKVGDVLLSINGTPITDMTGLRAALKAAGDKPSVLAIERAGKKQDVTVTTTAGEDGQRQIGIFLGASFDFPKTVKFGLENVGGPSAGMIFALGIIDKLTPGEMTGGKHFAGTGTITADGTVGPIGGIAQKLVGARDAGASYFLAPADNCADVAGRIPSGLDVIKVATLAEARSAVEGIAAGKDPASFPGCN